VTCTSGSNVLKSNSIPDSIKELPPEEYSEKGVRDVDVRKFDELT
jgi:hypothetical protein